MRRYNAPTLIMPTAAIQANANMQNSFNSLGSIANDFTRQKEAKRANEARELHSANILNETKSSNKFNQDMQIDKFNYEKNQNQEKKDANIATVKSLYPEFSKNTALQYGDLPTVENGNKLNSVLGSVNLSDLHNNKSFNYNVEKDKKTFDYNVNKDNRDFNYKKKQANIANSIAGERLKIAKQNAMGGGNTAEVKALKNAGIDPQSELGQKILKAMVYKKTLVPSVDKNGNTVMTPISKMMGEDKVGNEIFDTPIIKKTNDVDLNDVEDLNEAIKIANSIDFAEKNYKNDYTGMLDDKVNWIYNKLGIDNPKMRDYNEWATHLQSVGNAARNKSFGSALSGFDIDEFAKEFPSSDAGDGTVRTKLKVRREMLTNALNNTYNTWVEKYGKDRANQYFESLNDGMLNIQKNKASVPTEYSDDEILKAISGGK